MQRPVGGGGAAAATDVSTSGEDESNMSLRPAETLTSMDEGETDTSS